MFPRTHPQPPQKSPLRPLLWVALIGLLGAAAYLGWPYLQQVQLPAAASASTTGTPRPPEAATATPTPASIFAPRMQTFPGGLLVLSIQRGLTAHLFAYHPPDLPLTRLTDGNWMDIHPAISPDGQRVAFTSNRAGQWDLFVLDLSSGDVTRLTDTPAYEGHPSWSPDGLWLAYDAYTDDNLDILVQPVDGAQPPIQLTFDPHADFSPAWSPQGRQIAFVSTRSGEPEIWLADLDKVEDRFVNLSQSRSVQEDHPQWNADGSALAWSGTQDGLRQVYLWQEGRAYPVGNGDWPAWSPQGEQIATLLRQPNADYLSAFRLSDRLLSLPAEPLPGVLRGISWGNLTLPDPPPQVIQWAAEVTPTPLWQAQLTPQADLPAGRYHIAPLEDVQAPYAYLHDAADEAFAALRTQTAQAIGWDALSVLENAYLPLTAPAMPTMADDWLYTGRGIAINSAPLEAGWMVVVREAYGEETYWRIYLRALQQDGSQGLPLTQLPWDFSARYSGDPQGYEQGGLQISNPPPGYWVDFTALAQTYGWRRFPARPNWRTYFPATRFTEFALTENLDWEHALLQLYPPEMLITPTPVASATPTFTPTITPSPTITPTRTPRPTRTPWPTRTPIPSKTPSPTITPSITPTPTSTPQWGTGE
ncbi:MAG: hypothetical protein D6755_05765 [Anaerolineae bacterium]|nr:MAG: hypothetical protein D6755_05765 [Anaerolineae bacterium]